MHLMRPVRLILHLVALVTMLTLGAYGSSAVSKAELPGTHAHRSKTPIPSIPATRLGNKVVYPMRQAIPAIGINTFVESISVRPGGDLATPMQDPWEDVGWYDLGTHPGERGSAVIDGHLDRPGGYPAVFWRLRNVQVGDEVQVKNNAGNMLHFRVTRVAYYAPDQAPLQDIFGNLGGSYLNLITCAGDWIPGQHQTTLRLVVYTTFVLAWREVTRHMI